MNLHDTRIAGKSARHNRLLNSSALMAVALAALPSTTAFAQGASPQAASSGPQVQEIIVTAQRREESLQKVPVAVTAIGAEQLENLRVNSVRNLAGLAPSLQINSQGMQSNPTIIIRGISSGASSNSVDPKVGIYMDGVYIGRAVGSLLDFSDIERVEVLRGPQGTLFGRNATSGAISLTTAPPKGEWGVKATASYGNYDAIRGKVSLDLPQIGPFSVRLSYLHDEIKGDVRNLIAGQGVDLSLRAPEFGTQRFVDRLGHRNVDGGQVAVRGEFGNLTADYRFDYTDGYASGRAMQNLGVHPGGFAQLIDGILQLQPLIGGLTNAGTTGPLSAVGAATSMEHTVTQGHSLTLTLEASDSFTVKSITALRKFRQDPVIFDLGAAGGIRFSAANMAAFVGGNVGAILANPPAENDYFFPLLSARATSQKQFSQELQFQLSNDAYDLTAGLFYFHERAPGTEVLGVAALAVDGVIYPDPASDVTTGSGTTRTVGVNDSMAGYGQFTLHATPTLDLTAGIRGTLDDRELKILAISGAQGGSLGVGDYKLNYSKVTYTGIATWRPTNDATLFAKVATGYVAGGIISGIPYRPENLTSYEVGAKTQLWDNRVRLNVSAYYNDYKDLQTQNFINGKQAFDNAGKAKIKGFEVETDIVPVEGLTLSGSLAYSDFDYKQFVLGGFDVADVARPVYFSKWTGRAAAAYNSQELSAGGPRISALVEGRYRSSYFLTSTPFVDSAGDVVLEDQNHRPGYWLVNGRVGLVDIPLAGARASLSVFGDNLLNERYIAFGAPVFVLTGTYDRGRTYGVELGFQF